MRDSLTPSQASIEASSTCGRRIARELVDIDPSATEDAVDREFESIKS